MNTQRVQVRIDTYGSAPSRFGRGAVKVGIADTHLLQQVGWEFLGRGRWYNYMRKPPGTPTQNILIDVDVPTDEELLAVAQQHHAAGKQTKGVLAGFLFWYQPAQESCWEFGIGSPYRVRICWGKGNDASPRLTRFVC